MKLGISDQGFRRIAQELDGGVSGERELLNRVLDLLKNEDIHVTGSEVEYLIDMLNNTPSGELAVGKFLRTDSEWHLNADEVTKVLDILSPAAHEMLDYDFARSQEF